MREAARRLGFCDLEFDDWRWRLLPSREISRLGSLRDDGGDLGVDLFPGENAAELVDGRPAKEAIAAIVETSKTELGTKKKFC